jgi:hypothetical protein
MKGKCTMKHIRQYKRLIGQLLLFLMLVSTVGCASFVPLDENGTTSQRYDRESRVRVQTRDDCAYVFPGGQHTLRYGADSAIVSIKGWGDKYNSLGLIDKGYFELRRDQIRQVEIEAVKTSQLALIGGAVVGFTVLAYVGVKNIGGDNSSGRGKGESPAEGN